ncbi:MAG: YcgN family cysteine cluster protein [Pseudomonadota bacterium]
MEKPFWEQKSLSEMSPQEWESLCDGCAKCCLHKLEDEDTGDIYHTAIACRLLDLNTCRCGDYAQRKLKVSDCLVLRPQDIANIHWLPSTCAYRLVAQQQALPQWHPLVSGRVDSVHLAGVSIRGKVVSEVNVHPSEYEERIIQWVN